MDYNTENIKAYESLAEEYEKNISKYFLSTKEAVENIAPSITTGKEVLDVGCGVGLGTMMLIEKGFSLTSIDISPKMITFVKKRNPSATTITGEFLEYTFKKKFDAIFAMAFIHLFPKNIAQLILEKMHTLLKEDGVLYIGTTISDKSKEGFELKRDAFFPNGQQKRYRKHWTEEELLDSLQKAGFKYKHKYHIDDPRKKVWMDFLMTK
jgi:2-polyprenyl-3-methyl-5-hydroxy-6-metoxy-1,4-benzoquinol methylase